METDAILINEKELVRTCNDFETRHVDYTAFWNQSHLITPIRHELSLVTSKQHNY